MGLTASEGGDFKSAPVGSHIARCIGVIDLGTQHEEYQGEKKTAHKVLLKWELPGTLMDDGRPFVVSKFYTLSLHEKSALRKDLQAWRAKNFAADELKAFDLKMLLGKVCMVAVVDKPTGNGTKVAGVMAAPKGVPVPPSEAALVSFDIDSWDVGVYESLSDGLKKIIQESDEARRRNGSRKGVDPSADDDAGYDAGADSEIPF